MNWKRMLISAMTRKKYKMFLADTQNPQQVKESLWRDEVLPLLKQSSYWKPLLAARSSLDLSDFPITNYEDYEAGLLAAQSSTIQPFNGEELIFWSETSGTAGVRKFFPVTKSFREQFQRTIAPFIHSLTLRFSGFFKEKVLYLVAVDAHKTTPAGVPSGWISNFNYRHLPPFIKRFYAMPDDVFSSSEVYEQWAPLYALASDLSAMFAVTPMVIDAFYERCVNNFREYLPYLSGVKQVPSFLPAVKISKRRLQYLQELASHSRFPSFKEFWPSLVVAGCWTSGLCEYPARQLQALMGDEVSLVDGTYSATEGWLTVCLDSEPGGILHPGAHIVEFIEEGLEIDRRNLIQGWELEVGKNYEVFLTTAMGFVRYRLRDVVRCSGFLHRAPRLVFCYKTQLLKLESCAVTGQELQEMLAEVGFVMAPHWYFARNSLGDRVVLVTDDSVVVGEDVLLRMHEGLGRVSPTYSHSIVTKEVLPLVSLQLPLVDLLADAHAQTKPKLISQMVIGER